MTREMRFGEDAGNEIIKTVRETNRRMRNAEPYRGRWFNRTQPNTGAGAADCCCCPEPHVKVRACCNCLPPIACVVSLGEDAESDSDDLTTLLELDTPTACYAGTVRCLSGTEIELSVCVRTNTTTGACQFYVTGCGDPQWIDIPCSLFKDIDSTTETGQFLAEITIPVTCTNCTESLKMRFPRLIPCEVCSTCDALPFRLCVTVTHYTLAADQFAGSFELIWDKDSRKWVIEDSVAATFGYDTTTWLHGIEVFPEPNGCKLIVVVNSDEVVDQIEEYTIDPEECWSWEHVFDVALTTPIGSTPEEWRIRPMICQSTCEESVECFSEHPCLTDTTTLYLTVVPDAECDLAVTTTAATNVAGKWSWELTGDPGSSAISIECRRGYDSGGIFVPDAGAGFMLVLVESGCQATETVYLIPGACVGGDFVVDTPINIDSSLCCTGSGFPGFSVSITSVAP